MIDFQMPRPADKTWVDQRTAAGNYRGCEYSFTNLLAWGAAYDQRIADVEGFLVARVRNAGGDYGYLWPAGAGSVEKVLNLLMEDARERGEVFRLACITPEQAAELETLFPGGFHIGEDRDGFDYLYDVDKLADLGGRKLHSKRNHCARFQDNNPDWVYEDMTSGALAECLELAERWDEQSREREGIEEDNDLSNERKALDLCVKYFDALKLEGGLLRVEGRVVAFTMGDRLSPDTFDVHFEKAYGAIQGAYPMINREFCRRVRQRHPEVRWINREDDMGVEGLRKAKLSYYPDLMVEKHWAVLK